MRAALGLVVAVVLVGWFGCKRQQVTVTITYDPKPTFTFPYTSYGDEAKIYYTVGTENVVKTVWRHQTIQVIVPERVQMRATVDKYVTDANGITKTVADFFYTVDSDQPAWTF